MVAAEVAAPEVAVPDEAESVVEEESLPEEVEAGAEVTEEEPEEAVAVPVEDAVAAPDFKLGVWPAAQVAVVGRASASPTEPQIACANWMVAVMGWVWLVVLLKIWIVSCPGHMYPPDPPRRKLR